MVSFLPKLKPNDTHSMLAVHTVAGEVLEVLIFLNEMIYRIPSVRQDCNGLRPPGLSVRDGARPTVHGP